MGKLGAMPAQHIISSFKGVVDFYNYLGIPCFRQWPKSPGRKRSPAVEAQWDSFTKSSRLWNELGDEVREAYNSMASGTGLSGRDMFTRSYIKGLFTYPPRKEEGMNIIWKDASERALSDENRTTYLDWTGLDLTAYTSANAKFALLQLNFRAQDAGTAYDSWLQVRKNGTTPDYFPEIMITNTDPDWCYRTLCPILGLDANRKIQYNITVATGATVDSWIDVLGYVE